ncbi:acyl-CoA N-acyltransferase [Thelonectria olida]|uniref:Acyl-CoA N-acyltransferase n=1 Tax=Thelonectria olida TaxID=1576542 RepID=A0A9P8W3N8_9HYPO|nr:acyl-CoA N-acyltransferase [Thelonectria olida]
MSSTSSKDSSAQPSSTSTPAVSIRQATTEDDLASVARCFRAYTEWLGLDLTFQNYAAELSTLPGKYAPPSGALLLACDSETDQVLGCIALRPIELQPQYKAGRNADVRYCEIKRLYVYPEARGRRVAKTLVAEVIKAARGAGYDEALLDTLAIMGPAVSLYKSEGFLEVEPYYKNPLGGVIYMSKNLELPRQ